MAIRRILVPTDFSEPSLRALEQAIELAAPSRAEVALLHVVEPVQMAAATEFSGLTGGPFLDLLGEQEKAGRAELERLAKKLRRRRLSVHAVLRTGRAYGEIVDVAERLRADLIVMSTHGRSGLSHLLMGSVAEKVVRLAPCPVLTVGPRKPPAKRRKGRSGR